MFRLGKGKVEKIGDNSNGQNAVKERGKARANEKLAKKILGKATGRRVFGFACSPNIPAQLKVLAGELQVPMFALAEHCLQLSAEQIAKAKDNPEERDILRRHLIEIHVAQRTIEKINWYDEKLAQEFNEKRLGRLAIEQAVREIVVNFANKGLKPRDIGWYTDYGYRCFAAVIWGRPVPKDIPPWAESRQRSRASGNQPIEKIENETDNDTDDSSEESR